MDKKCTTNTSQPGHQRTVYVVCPCCAPAAVVLLPPPCTTPEGGAAAGSSESREEDEAAEEAGRPAVELLLHPLSCMAMHMLKI